MSIKKIIDRIQLWFVLRKFKKVRLPLIKSLMPTIIADEMVSIQPMQVPSGMIFHLDFVFNVGTYVYHIKLKRVVLINKNLMDTITKKQYKRKHLYKTNRICKLKPK